MSTESAGHRETSALMRLVTGGWVARIIFVAAELGLADQLENGTLDAPALATATGTNASALARLLRALAAVGVLHEDEERRYSLTPLGNVLRSDVPGSMRGWVLHAESDELRRSWGALGHGIQTGENPFIYANGSDVWSYMAAHPQRSAIFDAAMQGLTTGVNAAISAHEVFGECRWIVDVGGGNGSLLIAILQRHEALRGSILDLPHVIEGARRRIEAASLTSRCEAVSGDAFQAVPAGADAYLMKSVLHDWEDAEALRILRTCRAAMPPSARLLVVERLMPDRIEAGDQLALANALNDMNMFVNPAGRERTETEFAALFRDAGLDLVRVLKTSGPSIIMEATPG